MHGIDHHPSSGSLRATCEGIVHALSIKHSWQLLPERDLVELMIAGLSQDEQPVQLEREIYQQYIIALHKGCLQSGDKALRERAYTDLFHYLYRAAYNRWPDMAEDATQRALMLVFENIETCRVPAAFLGFAYNKLRQAVTEIVRGKTNEQPIDDEKLAGILFVDEQPPIEASTLDQERLAMLIHATRRMRDQRERQVILLRFFEELSDKEIGEQLQITTSNVRILRFRGLSHLRNDRQLKHYFEGTAE
jgi:RNA polymerase sigma factor (sigma-70 family)